MITSKAKENFSPYTPEHSRKVTSQVVLLTNAGHNYIAVAAWCNQVKETFKLRFPKLTLILMCWRHSYFKVWLENCQIKVGVVAMAVAMWLCSKDWGSQSNTSSASWQMIVQFRKIQDEPEPVGACLSSEMQNISHWTTYACKKSHLCGPGAQLPEERKQHIEHQSILATMKLFHHSHPPPHPCTQTPSVHFLCTCELKMVTTPSPRNLNTICWQSLEKGMFLWLYVKSMKIKSFIHQTIGVLREYRSEQIHLSLQHQTYHLKIQAF